MDNGPKEPLGLHWPVGSGNGHASLERSELEGESFVRKANIAPLVFGGLAAWLAVKLASEYLQFTPSLVSLGRVPGRDSGRFPGRNPEREPLPWKPLPRDPGALYLGKPCRGNFVGERCTFYSFWFPFELEFSHSTHSTHSTHSGLGSPYSENLVCVVLNLTTVNGFQLF